MSSKAYTAYQTIYEKVLKPYQREWVDSILEGDTVILGSRRIGKSFTVAFAALLLCGGVEHKGKRLKPDDVVIISKDLRTAQEVIREVQKHSDTFDAIEKITHNKRGSVTTVWLRNGKKITALPGMPKSARGLSGHVIVDEFAHNESDPNDLYAMSTTIPSAKSGGRTVILSNADMQGSWFDNFINSEEEEWKSLRTGFKMITTTVWDAYPGEESLPPHIEMQQKRLPYATWAREYCCQFLSGGDSAFGDLSGVAIAKSPGGRTVLSWDPGWTGDPAGWCLSHVLGGRIHILDAGLGWDMSEQEQRAKIHNYVRTQGVDCVLVDPGTAGFVLAANLKSELGPIVQSMSCNAKRYSEWSRELAIAIKEGRITRDESLPWIELKGQLNAITDMGGTIHIPRTKLGTRILHQDAAVALMMTASQLGSSTRRPKMLPRHDLGVRRGLRF